MKLVVVIKNKSFSFPIDWTARAAVTFACRVVMNNENTP